MNDVKIIMDMLIVAKEQIDGKEEYIDFLTFCKKFYNKEFKNQLLIYSQNKYATIIKSFLEWKYVGRKIKKNPNTISLCKPYKKKNKKFIDGQFDINGKAKKERKNNKIEVIGEQTIEKTFGYDISDTLIDRTSKYKQPVILIDNVDIDKKKIHNLFKEIWTRYNNDIENVDDDIIYRLRGMYEYLFEKDEIPFYETFIDSMIFLTANYFNIQINSELQFKEYDKLVTLSLEDFLKFGIKLQESSEKMIDYFRKELDIELSA